MSGALIKPVQQDEDLISDVSSVEHDNDHFHVWWLGQSGFLLCGGFRGSLTCPEVWEIKDA